MILLLKIKHIFNDINLVYILERYFSTIKFSDKIDINGIIRCKIYVTESDYCYIYTFDGVNKIEYRLYDQKMLNIQPTKYIILHDKDDVNQYRCKHRYAIIIKHRDDI